MRTWRFFKTLKQLLLLAPAVLSGCVGVPSGVTPVSDFDVSRYLGTWYEIARLDHSFERGLTNVSATYTLRDDGGINVLNRGYDPRTGKWKEAKGRAYFVKDRVTGFLKVSFFGPFYGSYVIMALDHDDYAYALVCGPKRSYLWLLARETTLPQPTVDTLLAQAQALDFDTDALIFVTHDQPRID